MEINNNLQVQNLTIEQLYKLYKSEKLLVNRRYQRKLVWTVKDTETYWHLTPYGFRVMMNLKALRGDAD